MWLIIFTFFVESNNNLLYYFDNII